MTKVNFPEEVVKFMKYQGLIANILKDVSNDPLINVQRLNNATEKDLNHFIGFPPYWYLEENGEIFQLEWNEVPKPIMEDIIYGIEYFKNLIENK